MANSMASADTGAPLAFQLLELLQTRVSREVGSTVDGVLQLRVAREGEFYGVFRDGESTFHEGVHPRPAFLIEAEPKFIEFVLGRRAVDPRSPEYRVHIERFAPGADGFWHWINYLMNEPSPGVVAVYERAERAALDIAEPSGIERFPVSAIDEAVRRRHPVVITGAADHWPAMGWTAERLATELGDAAIGGIPMRVLFGEPDPGAAGLEYRTTWGASALPADLSSWFDDFDLRFLQGLVPPPAPMTMGPKVFAGFRPRHERKVMHRDPGDGYLFQIIGKKRIVFYNMDQKPFLYPVQHYLTSQPSWVDGGNPDEARHPLFKQARGHEVVIDKGDLLFLPSGWWHDVEELEPTFTLNFYVGYNGA